MQREDSKVIPLKITNPLGANSPLSNVPTERRHPTGHSRGDPGTAGSVTCRRRVAGVAPFLLTLTTHARETMRERSCQRPKTLRNLFPRAQNKYPRQERTLPPPDPGVRETEQNTRGAALTHFPERHSCKTFRPLARLGPLTTRQDAGRGRPVRGGGGAPSGKTQRDCADPDGKTARLSWGVSGRGLLSRQPEGVWPHNSASISADRPLRSRFAQHGEQEKWGDQVKGRALLLLQRCEMM